MNALILLLLPVLWLIFGFLARGLAAERDYRAKDFLLGGPFAYHAAKTAHEYKVNEELVVVEDAPPSVLQLGQAEQVTQGHALPAAPPPTVSPLPGGLPDYSGPGGLQASLGSGEVPSYQPLPIGMPEVPATPAYEDASIQASLGEKEESSVVIAPPPSGAARAGSDDKSPILRAIRKMGGGKGGAASSGKSGEAKKPTKVFGVELSGFKMPGSSGSGEKSKAREALPLPAAGVCGACGKNSYADFYGLCANCSHPFSPVDIDG